MLEFLALEREYTPDKDFIPRVYDVQVESLKRWKTGRTRLASFVTTFQLPNARKNRAIKKYFNQKIASNKSQVEAVNNAVSGNYPIFNIQGPPGTGKTSVIIEIIRQELYRNPRSKILVVSQSNLAVDNVLEKLIEVKGIKVLRLGHDEKVTESVKPYLLENLKPGIYFRGNFKKIIRNILKFFLLAPFLLLSRRPNRFSKKKNLDLYELISNEIQVIGSTCIGSYDKIVQYLDQQRSKTISLLIVDEAGRSTTMETMVPLQFAKRAILVGDHKQLPPVLKPEIRKAWKEHFPNIPLEQCPGYYSYFEYITKYLPKAAFAVLDVQFRMHPQIGNFVSEVFYKEEGLTTGVSAEQCSLPIANYPEAVSYHSTVSYADQRFEKFHTEIQSYYNSAEAKTIIKLLHQLDQPTTEAGITIISFYSAQVELIRQLLAKVNFISLKEVEVATLDSFQGREQDVIILSLVRCPSDLKGFDASWYRFFLDLKRLNVALSRARKRLMIVGDLDRVMEISRNKEKVPGFEAMEKLIQYIDQHQLRVVN